MKRRIIKQGHSTHTITLPAKWIKKYGFNAGDEVDMDEQGKNLIISSEKDFASNKASFDISDLPKFLIQHYLIAIYRSGADEIELRFKNPIAKDLKRKKDVKVLNVIQDTVNELIGVEIIRHTDKSCTIKQLSEISDHEFDNVLRRIFLLLTDLSEETYQNLKDENIDGLLNAKFKHKTIRKFVNFCLRLLNKKGHKDYRKTSLYYYLISQTEQIAGVYRYISIEVASENKKIRPESLNILKDVNNSLKLVYETVFKFDKNKTMEILKLRRTIFDNINSLSKKADCDNLTFFNRLAVVVLMIMEITETKVSMQI